MVLRPIKYEESLRDNGLCNLEKRRRGGRREDLIRPNEDYFFALGKKSSPFIWHFFIFDRSST